ncbi:alpha-methylacyl-CoA racemase [Aricia agestis]|uniref:alpha-methylacyl-CoA racemase n=1 Tax=Aricia agestis TaxID=91739 RepID=UPI001C208254|nr:alpha-methylacyl-CoA racemase [Aricia agestis]
MALHNLRVIEMMGLAPGPLSGTILADFGAAVTVVQKVGQVVPADTLSNGKRSIAINLKSSDGVKILKSLCNNADVLIDTYRPGVMEKLGLGPEVILNNNPKLIYSRLTGYGQNGYFMQKGGHDINYVAMSGILSLLKKDRIPPSPPLNLLADFAGGSVICVVGILLALLERQRSGKGQVVDASMTEGVAYIASWIFKNQHLLWTMESGSNFLDGGYHFYNTYETKDTKYMAVGAIEPHFYSNLLKGLNLSQEECPYIEKDIGKEKFKEVFLTKTQKEWCEIFDQLDACVTPVLEMNSVDKHKCNKSRQIFFRNVDNIMLPNPAPRLSRTPGESSNKLKATEPGQHTIEIMKELGYNNTKIKNLLESGIICGKVKSNL